MHEDTPLQDTYTWFFDMTGLYEDDWLMQRDKSIIQKSNGDLQIRNLQTGEHHEAGQFSVHNLHELTNHNLDVQTEYPPFEVHIRSDRTGIRQVDVAHLQAQAPERTLFQVASNFNCAEVPSQHTDPTNGHFVTNLAVDRTQGPAASASGGISAITRIHAAFYNPHTHPSTWGQTMERQIELLGHPLVKPHFPVTNGKLWFKGTEPQDCDPEVILPHIRVGLHQRVRPYFGFRIPPFMEKIEHPPSIDQVFVAALNRRAPLPYAHHLISKTQLLLQAAYQGTYQCAAQCQNPLLILTLIGGGSFANPPDLIAKAIAQAHKNWSRQTKLEKVILPLFPVDGMVQGQNFGELLTEAFTSEGIEDCLSIKMV